MAEGSSYICEVNETRNQLLARKTVHDIYNILYGAVLCKSSRQKFEIQLRSVNSRLLYFTLPSRGRKKLALTLSGKKLFLPTFLKEEKD